ncbi:MAG: metal ABC transporter permease [Bacteriovoracaceae bacterium]|nr:metal ABC transporter permease [Bacteriovoracaceae bacterium]
MLDFFQYDFLTKALVGGLLLAFSCGILSPWVVAKRYAFMSEGIAHSTLLSFALTLSLVSLENTFSFYTLYVVISLFLVFILATFTYLERLPSDTLMGLFLSGTLSLGLLFHFLYGKGQMDLSSFLFGNILFIENIDITFLLILSLLCFLIFYYGWKKWLYLTFDPEGAKISGIKDSFYHYAFFLLLGILILSAIKFCGTLLTNTLLIFPGAFALKLARSMKQAIFISVLFSLITLTLGLFLSNFYEIPPGAGLTLTQLFFFSLTFFKKRSFL